MKAVQQVTEFASQLHAALGQHARVQRGVVVGRKVEVVGHQKVEAAAFGGANGGPQHAGLACVVEREIHPRRIQDGHTEKVQRGVARDTDVAGLVDVEVAHLEVPVVVVDRAGGVGGVLQFVVVLVDEVDAAGAAAARFGSELVDRLRQLAAVIVEVEPERISRHRQRRLFQPHLTARLNLVQRGVVAQPVGKEILAGLAGFDIAAGFDDAGRGRFDVVGHQEQRGFLAGHPGFAQLGIAFQHEPLSRRAGGGQQQCGEGKTGQGGQAM